MKKVSILIVFIAIVQLSYGQFKIGVRAGLNSTSLKMDELITADNFDQLKLTASKAKVGFHAGIISRVQIMSFYLQPELLFTATKSEVKVENITQGNVNFKDQSFNRLDLPIMAGWEFGDDFFGFRVQAGPIASVTLSSNSITENIANIQPKKDFNRATWGYQAGIGLDLFEKLAIDLKYEGGLSKLGDGVVVAGKTRTFDSRANQWVLSLGFFL